MARLQNLAKLKNLSFLDSNYKHLVFQKVFTFLDSKYKLENIDVDTNSTPPGTDPSTGAAFGTWGNWIVDTAGLDKTKWKVTVDAIEPIYEVDATDPTASKGCGKVIEINPNVNNANGPATITFDPDELTDDKALCKWQFGI